jgi:hypothetical protein
MRLLLILLMIPLVYAQVITEVMYNPFGTDNNKEYVEVLGKNLSGFIIADSASSDILVLLQEKDSPYALIVEEGYDISQTSCSVYSIGSAIGNGLSEGETLRLINNGTEIDTFFIAAVGEGYSIDREGKNILGGSPCVPTPDIPQFCEPKFQISTDKRLYEPGETAELLFDDIPPDATLEYGVRDGTGKQVKASKITSTDEPKHWQVPQEGMFEFYAVLDAPCMQDTIEKSTLFGIRQKELIPTIDIRSVEVLGTLAKVEVSLIGKGKIEMKVKRDKKSFSSIEQTLDGRFEGTLFFSLPCGEDAEIVVEGLGEIERKSISLLPCPVTGKKENRPQIDSFYLRQKEIEDSVTLYSHASFTGQAQLTTCSLLSTGIYNESDTFSFPTQIREDTTILLLLHNESGPLALSSLEVNVTPREGTDQRRDLESSTTNNQSSMTLNQRSSKEQQPLTPVTLTLPQQPKILFPGKIVGTLILGFVLLLGIATRLTGRARNLHKSASSQSIDDPADLSAPSRSE